MLICIYAALLSIFNIDLIDLLKRLCYWLFNITFRYALTTILPILFLYLNTVTVTVGTFEP